MLVDVCFECGYVALSKAMMIMNPSTAIPAAFITSIIISVMSVCLANFFFY